MLLPFDNVTFKLVYNVAQIRRICHLSSAFDYMLATREYVDKHGKPVAFYSDKHAVFRVSQAETRRTGMTQFGRALHELNIQLIYIIRSRKSVKPPPQGILQTSFQPAASLQPELAAVVRATKLITIYLLGMQENS